MISFCLFSFGSLQKLMRLERLFSHPVFQLFLLAAAIASVYGHVFDVPFYLDDHLSIERNEAIRSLDFDSLYRYSPKRVVGYLSFALDYQLHGLEPAGYHLFNVIVHVLSAWMAWGLAGMILMTPAMKERLPSSVARGFPLVVALIFALHPLQTQAITYITQRLASLAAFWYLAALACYFKARLSLEWPRRTIWFAGCGLAAVLAFHTKENTVTLPLAVLLVEWAFFARGRYRLWLSVVLLTAVGAGLVLLWALTHVDTPFFRYLDGATRETRWFDRGDYLAAQMKALWWYVRLFFWPFGLRLDYAAHRPPSWSDPEVLLGAGGHVLVILTVIGFLRRYPLPAFGVLFYYLAHAVESSVIPIRDLLFEHRTYLPNFGLALTAAWGLSIWRPVRRIQSGWWRHAVTGCLIVALGFLTWQRNQLWRDPVAFWQANVRLEPESYRPWMELGNAYFDTGQIEEARRVARELVMVLERNGWQPGREELTETEVGNIALAYSLVRRHRDAARVARHYLKVFRSPEVKAGFHLVLGDEALMRKDYETAEKHYRKAVALEPGRLDGWLSLGEALGAQGRLREARQAFQEVLKREPDNPRARRKLALADYLLQRRGDAPPSPR